MTITATDPVYGVSILQSWGEAVFRDLTSIDASITSLAPFLLPRTPTPRRGPGSNPSIGNGTLDGTYVYVGKLGLVDILVMLAAQRPRARANRFPTGAHDDQVDTMTQAVNRLLLNPILSGDMVFADETDDDF